MSFLDHDHCACHPELAERLITETRRANLATKALRDWQRHVDEEAGASYVTALHARIAVLEANVQKMSKRRAA